MTATLILGDALESLQKLRDGAVRCCVTSPPYWGLRDYGMTGQLGLEPTPDAYVAAMVKVFAEVRRVLADDGTLWLNLGDSYGRAGGWSNNNGLDGVTRHESNRARTNAPEGVASQKLAEGIKPKDLVGIPWRVAFALQADGWYLRSDIIWAKPNPMPESVTDRPTKSHEYLFLMAKSERYYYKQDAIAEPVISSDADLARARITGRGNQAASAAYLGSPQRDKSGGFPLKQDGHGRRHAGFNERWDNSDGDQRPTRNARSVWTIATQPYSGAHFATFPEELARRCIMAGSAPGDTILDPFSGSGTVAAVAVGNGRKAIGIELNPAYLELARQRIGPMFLAAS